MFDFNMFDIGSGKDLFLLRSTKLNAISVIFAGRPTVFTDLAPTQQGADYIIANHIMHVSSHVYALGREDSVNGILGCVKKW